jgi:hypothetical protein
MFKTHIHEQEKPNEKSQAGYSSHLNNNGSKRTHLTWSKHMSMNKRNQARGAKRNLFPT